MTWQPEPVNPNQQPQSSAESDARLKKLEGWISLLRTKPGQVALITLIGLIFTGYQAFQGQRAEVVAPIESAEAKPVESKPVDQKPANVSELEVLKKEFDAWKAAAEAREKAAADRMNSFEQQRMEVMKFLNDMQRQIDAVQKKASEEVMMDVEPAPPLVSLYEAAIAAATTAQKPLVIFVNTAARSIEGCQTVRLQSLEGNASPRILLATPDRSLGMAWTQIGGQWSAPPGTSDVAIRRAAGLEKAAPPARAVQC